MPLSCSTHFTTKKTDDILSELGLNPLSGDNRNIIFSNIIHFDLYQQQDEFNFEAAIYAMKKYEMLEYYAGNIKYISGFVNHILDKSDNINIAISTKRSKLGDINILINNSEGMIRPTEETEKILAKCRVELEEKDKIEVDDFTANRVIPNRKNEIIRNARTILFLLAAFGISIFILINFLQSSEPHCVEIETENDQIKPLNNLEISDGETVIWSICDLNYSYELIREDGSWNGPIYLNSSYKEHKYIFDEKGNFSFTIKHNESDSTVRFNVNSTHFSLLDLLSQLLKDLSQTSNELNTTTLW